MKFGAERRESEWKASALNRSINVQHQCLAFAVKHARCTGCPVSPGAIDKDQGGRGPLAVPQLGEVKVLEGWLHQREDILSLNENLAGVVRGLVGAVPAAE